MVEMLVETKVKLSPILKEDAPILFKWINDAETVRFNNTYKPISWESHIVWFEALGKDTSKVIFGIRSFEDDRLIGTIQLTNIHTIYRSAEISIRIGEHSDRNRGVGSAAIKLAVQFAFNDLNLMRVYLHVFADNSRAVSVYKKIGFLEEGRLQRAAYINGKWVDVLVMALLKGPM